MADPEHLRILKQGAKAFNEWRVENPYTLPFLLNANLRGADLKWMDLRKADFRGVNLSGMDLSGTNLRGAYFGGANLRGVYLRGVYLREAYLSGVDLRGANLTGADLRVANLRKADLSKADLTGADLRGANLSGANLTETGLRGARFRGADLSDANLTGADLRMAYLNGTDLRWADLRGADLNEAGLRGADLRFANMNKANLNGAKFGYTIFGDIDLSDVSGLESTRHTGPSTIGIDTIFRSGGKIPPKFIEDAGVPGIFIEYMGSLTGQAFQFYSCFISYSNNNKEFADRLYADLRKEGVRCWFADEDLEIGSEIRPAIEDEIRLRDKVLLILSNSSIKSEWVKDEVEAAYEEERQRNKTVLFPIRIDQSVMVTKKSWAAKLRRQRNIGDFTNWKDHDSYQNAFKRLLRDLHAEER